MPVAGNKRKLEAENARLAAELAEAQDILRALRKGEVDALVSSESDAVYAVQLIALAIDKAESYSNALALLIGRLCEATHSDYCEAWAVTPDLRTLHRTPVWCGTGTDAVRLHEAVAATPGPPAALLEVFRSGKLQWLAVENMQGARALQMRNGGLKSGLVLPLVVDERVLAVLTLWTLERRERDDGVATIAQRILDETGRFLQRKLDADSRQDTLRALYDVVQDRSRRVLELGSELEHKTQERDEAEKRSHREQQVRVQSERALHQETALLESVLDGMVDGVVVTNATGKVLRFNAAAQELLGKAPDAPLERWPETYGLYRAENEAILGASDMPLIQALRGERTIHMEMFISNDKSKDRTVEVSASPVHSVDGSAAFGAVMLLHDVTERRRGESLRRTELVRQREALVRQVHHNVKNSLAGIVALVQQHALERPEMKELTENVEARLSAIAIVHGMQARDGSGIVFGSLVNSLKDNIRTLFGASMNMDTGEDGVWGLRLSESESVPLALALSELLVNACKHGNRRSLDFSAAREGQDLVIKIANNATQDIHSLGRSIEGGNGHGLGIELVRSLLPRDKARLDYKQTGTRVEAILRLTPAVFQPSA